VGVGTIIFKFWCYMSWEIAKTKFHSMVFYCSPFTVCQQFWSVDMVLVRTCQVSRQCTGNYQYLHSTRDSYNLSLCHSHFTFKLVGLRLRLVGCFQLFDLSGTCNQLLLKIYGSVFFFLISHYFRLYCKIISIWEF
jgi:hypothetical protein